ncbi:hypothetical protein FRC02_010721 [Tulasnella sp. 418]|nr:hypothetical protein FRC02_010721 [Tulasnella sp. 418]
MDILQKVEHLVLDDNPSESTQEESENAHIPDLSYHLTALTKGKSEGARRWGNYHTAVYFPWGEGSAASVFGDRIPSDDERARWRKVTREWAHIVAICGLSEILLIRTIPGKPISLLTRKLVHAEEFLRALTWVIEPDTLNPLLAFGGDGAILYIWDPWSKAMKGLLRGHGGAITSLCVHPKYFHNVASSSRDRSVRIYDLRLKAYKRILTLSRPHKSSQPNNLSDKARHRALTNSGAPLGDAMADEGRGIGKCVLVLAGQAIGSGGHEAAILDADFHPTLPLIATGGLDRCVKIWFIPTIRDTLDSAAPKLFVEDKPLFSSSMLHECRVTSIKWISKDTLLSKSSEDRLGTMVLWKWLALEHYFPQLIDETQSSVGKPKSDYEECRSFTVLATFPIDSSKQDDFKMSVHRVFKGKAPIFVLPTKTNEVHIWEFQRTFTPPNALAVQFIQNTVESPDDDRELDEDDAVPDGGGGKKHSRRSKRRKLSPTVSEIDYSGGDGPSVILSIEDRLRMMSPESEETWTEVHLKQHWLSSATFSPAEGDSAVAVGDGGIIAVWTRMSST